MLVEGRCLSWGGEAQPRRFDPRLGTRAHPELPEDRGDVVVDRPPRDDEPLGDLRIPEAFRHEGEHLELAGRESGWILSGGGPWATRQSAYALLAKTAGD